MTSIQEQIGLDGLEFNDGVLFSIEDGSFGFKSAQKQPQWIDNPDADGSALAYEPNYTNAEFAFSVRIEPKVTMDLALEAFGQIQTKLQKAERMRDQGGLPLSWTPAGSSETYTWYALLGELTDLPITAQGDLAGWFVNSPVIPVKITCRPFGYRPRRVVLTPATNATPLQVVELKEVGGDVPAEGVATLTDKAGVDRRHLEWGLDQFTGPSLITAASLSTTGFTGALKTRAGAYSLEKVIRGIALTQATPLCGTGPLSCLGSYRVKARVYVTSAAVRFQALYRTGDGPWKTLPPVVPPVINNFAEIDLGEVTFEELIAGTQKSEVKIEPFTTEGTSEPDVNYFELIPTTSGWGKARGLQSPKPSALLAYDNFEQPEGNLEGKALPLGGNWAGAGKTGANGFKVDVATHRAVRAQVSDSADLKAGCFAIAGATAYGATQVSGLLSVSNPPAFGGVAVCGLLARYINPENWFIGVWKNLVSFNYLTVYKCVAGVITELYAEGALGKEFELPSATPISLTANSDGTWQGALGAIVFQGQDADLVSGGALASGKPGMYDAWMSPTASTRAIDNFTVNGVEQAGRVLYANRKAEIRADVEDPVQRQDSTGVYYGAPNSYRGDRFEIPPAGDTGAIARFVSKLRRNDVDLESDNNVTDNQELEVQIAERFLAPR